MLIFVPVPLGPGALGHGPMGQGEHGPRPMSQRPLGPREIAEKQNKTSMDVINTIEEEVEYQNPKI